MNSLLGQSVFSQEVSQAILPSLLRQAQLEDPKALLILCCDKNADKREFFNAILPKISVPIFGGVFPAVVHDGQVIEEGIVIIPIHVPVKVQIYKNLENAPSTPFDLSFNLSNCQSAMVLVDGLARNIDYALNQLFQVFGQQLTVFGGGAGSLSFTQKPCLFSNQGILADAMLIVTMQQPWELAIGHGWEVLEGPFLANQVDDNRIIQLNFQPAIDVYRDVVERHDGRLFAENDFFELAKTYPFGLERLDDDLLVRDPVTVEGDSLICVGKVPENTMLYILKGEPHQLIAAAAQAIKNTSGKGGQGLLFDCISRQLFLEQDFSKELEGISDALGCNNLLGALVLGEIASGPSGVIHFHNKTAVTAVAKNSDNS